MFIFKISTTRPNTDNPFFIHTSLGQTYEQLMDESRATRPTEGVYGLTGFLRYESPDSLTMVTEYHFESQYGKEALLDNFAVRSITNGLAPAYDARTDYNESVGHVTVVTFEKQEG